MRATDEHKATILRERARILALAVERAEVPDTYTEVVTFLLAGEEYAVPSTHVREVLVCKEVTPLPCTPPFVVGIMNLRGQILPVIELTRALELQPSASGAQALGRIIVARAVGADVGIKVDAIFGVRRLPTDAPRPSPSDVSSVQAPSVCGLTSAPPIVLDVEKLLSDTALTADRPMARSTDGPLAGVL